MFMCDRRNRIGTIIDNHIHVWSTIPSFASLAQVLQRDRHILEEQLASQSEQGFSKGREGLDAVRLFLLRYALEHSAGAIQAEHFTIFREEETVQVILEDSYGVRPGADLDGVDHACTSLNGWCMSEGNPSRRTVRGGTQRWRARREGK